MTLVDERGRVFGRWNVVDAMIGVVLLGAIPLLYGGVALFRPQPASLTSIEPARAEAPATVDLTVRGNNLRPYMRVSLGNHQGQNFLFADQTRAVVRVDGIPPGVYDVILYDNAQERARLPKAFEVVASPRATTEVELIGTFTAITEPFAAQIKPDVKIEGLGQILRVGKPQPSVTRAMVGPSELLTVASTNASNIPAAIRASCTLVPRGGSVVCMALEHQLTRDAVLSLPLSAGNVMFQIDQVRAAGEAATVEVRARLSGERAVVERVRRGDRDIERGNEFAAGAEIVSVSAVTRATADVIVTAVLPSQSTPTISAGDLASVEVVLRVPVQAAGDRWSYRGQTLTPGQGFIFHNPEYELSAIVLAVSGK